MPHQLGRKTRPQPRGEEFVSVIQDHVIDYNLKTWMLSNFSTTTDHDRTVAVFSTMSVLHQYFDYDIFIGCVLPSMTRMSALQHHFDYKVFIGGGLPSDPVG